MMFDSHAHYDDERFDPDRHEVIKKAYESGVSFILNSASDLASSEKSIALAHRYDFIYASVGVHPHNADELDDAALEKLAVLAKDSKVVAVGEIGLDYYYDNSPRETQKSCFARLINFAGEIRLPIIVHDRDAHEDSLQIIKREHASAAGGVFHCFTGSIEMARELMKHNFYFAFGGSVTFKNARRLIEVVRYIPNDRLLIETDSPYLTPEPFRGKRNDSSYVRLVAEKIAQIKELSYEEVAEMTANNAKTLFKIKGRAD